jgi:hypothetical protein
MKDLTRPPYIGSAAPRQHNDNCRSSTVAIQRLRANLFVGASRAGGFKEARDSQG